MPYTGPLPTIFLAIKSGTLNVPRYGSPQFSITLLVLIALNVPPSSNGDILTTNVAPVPPDTDTVGAVAYPCPLFVILKNKIFPFESTAPTDASILTPPAGAEVIVTLEDVVYPDPPVTTSIPLLDLPPYFVPTISYNPG